LVGPAEPELINLLYVGRLAPEKNLQWVVDAWNAVGHKTNLRLTIVGSGDIELLKDIEHKDRVLVTGPLRGDSLIEQYQKGDIFLCPSETETFGNVVAEAGMAGNMVVTSAKGAARYVLPTTAFPCARSKDFTEVIELFINNPRKMYEMQHETQKQAKSLYSIETFVTSFTDALDGAL
jgi:glycosyltransferase involved in cell wall biosynthesis